MDQIDIAQERDHLLREHALVMTIKIVKESAYEVPLILDGMRCCLDCKDIIPQKRLFIRPGAVRCVSCQTRRERTHYKWHKLIEPCLDESCFDF
jgi:DnaK suppressor protein